MNTYFALFTIPFFSIGLCGILQVCDEMFANKIQLPIEDMSRPTARMQFGVQPTLAQTVRGSLSILAEKPMPELFPMSAAAESAELIVVGAFSVLDGFKQPAPVQGHQKLPVAASIPQPMRMGAWASTPVRDPRQDVELQSN